MSIPAGADQSYTWNENPGKESEAAGMQFFRVRWALQ
jgi:hypothetical protein